MDEAHWRSFARDDGGLDRFGRKTGAYHDAVVGAFHSLAEADPKRFRIVNAEGPIKEVTERLVAALEDLL